MKEAAGRGKKEGGRRELVQSEFEKHSIFERVIPNKTGFARSNLGNTELNIRSRPL